MRVEFYNNEHCAVNFMLQSTNGKQFIKLKIITYFQEPCVLFELFYFKY